MGETLTSGPAGNSPTTSGGIAVSTRAPTGEVYGRLAAAQVRRPTPDKMTHACEPPLVCLLDAADTWLLGRTNKVTVCQRAAYATPGAIGRDSGQGRRTHSH